MAAGRGSYELVVLGDKAIERALRELGEVSNAKRNRAVARAVAVALTPVRKLARAKVRVQKHASPRGTLKKSLIKIGRRYQRGAVIAGLVGPRTKFQRRVSVRGVEKLAIPSKYAHLVEQGHKIAGGGGRVRAYPFLKPAFDALRNQMLYILRTKLRENISREWIRLARGK